MTVGIIPAKRHGKWLPSREAAAMDGADDENVGEAVHPHVSQLPKRVKGFIGLGLTVKAGKDNASNVTPPCSDA